MGNCLELSPVSNFFFAYFNQIMGNSRKQSLWGTSSYPAFGTAYMLENILALAFFYGEQKVPHKNLVPHNDNERFAKFPITELS